MVFTVAFENDLFGNEHLKRNKTYCVVMETEFYTKDSTAVPVTLMNQAEADAVHPSLTVLLMWCLVSE